ncbi:hypothetical protein EV383_1862 [Pseudonocardia sediminis]|uniref:Uncharacterized protein n=1 Tax=Pseudonocardia sediminis TaxID=1397368 RepID=A0A4V2FQJ9_PSEST|nr:hypothetical protein [Pseudonocardia sediminis]RZT85000.1 hypothetical protein EV383_1862 [Pseudonocardia sediminis]
MGLREVTGYIAHALLAGYWIWVVSSTAAQLRSTSRSPRLRLQVALVKTAGIAVTAVVVGVIHFWATHWWHVVVTLVVAAPVGVGLRHVYKRLVVAPRHRRALVQRAQVYDLIHHGDRNVRISGPIPFTPPRGLRQPHAEPRHRTIPLPRPSADRPSANVERWWTSKHEPAAQPPPTEERPGPASEGSTAPW